MERERVRILSFEQAAQAFVLQLEIYPPLMAEFDRLSDGKPGVINALLETIVDEISYTPAEDTTPQRMRAIVGAPADDSQLDEWRLNFWEKYKAAAQADSSND